MRRRDCSMLIRRLHSSPLHYNAYQGLGLMNQVKCVINNYNSMSFFIIDLISLGAI